MAKNVGGRPRTRRELTEVEKFYIRGNLDKSVKELGDTLIAHELDVKEYVESLPPVEPTPPEQLIAIDTIGRDRKNLKEGKSGRFVVMSEPASQLADNHRENMKGKQKDHPGIFHLPKRPVKE